jgi:ribosomal silencing factor RsfS
MEADEMTELPAETRIPLTWIVTTTGTILAFLSVLLWNVAGQSSKLDTLVINSVKSDTKVETLRDTVFSIQRVQDTNTIRITALEMSKK